MIAAVLAKTLRVIISQRALDALSSIALLGAGGVVLWAHLVLPRAAAPVSISVPTTPVPFADAPTLGSGGAKVGVIMFSDFQCSFCERFDREVLPIIRERYIDAGTVALGYRFLPLSAIHPVARAAANAAACAAIQGKFWDLHDRLMELPLIASEDELNLRVRQTEVDRDALASCVSAAGSERVSGDLSLASELGISATPTFVLGTIRPAGVLSATDVVQGVRPVQEFERILDRLLDRVE